MPKNPSGLELSWSFMLWLRKEMENTIKKKWHEKWHLRGFSIGKTKKATLPERSGSLIVVETASNCFLILQKAVPDCSGCRTISSSRWDVGRCGLTVVSLVSAPSRIFLLAWLRMACLWNRFPWIHPILHHASLRGRPSESNSRPAKALISLLHA